MIDRTLFIVGWIFVSWFAIQTLPLTGLVFAPEEVEITGDQVALARHFPMDRFVEWRPRLSYVETVQPLTQSHNGGQSCIDVGGPFRYSRADVVGQWSISWAQECLSDPRGFTWSATWTWNIGEILVGPVSLTTRVLHDPRLSKVDGSSVDFYRLYQTQIGTSNHLPTRTSE